MTRPRSSLAPSFGEVAGGIPGSASRRPPLPLAPYLVVGLGRAGLAAARALTARSGLGEVRAWDARADPTQRRHAAELRALGVDVSLGGDGLDLLAGVATVIKSPGVPPEIPLVQAAQRSNLTIVDEVEIGWTLVPAPTVGITGTKGKSTVAALCMATLAAHGLDPALCGNTDFGAAVTELATGPRPDFLVAELSSYQLEFSRALAVDAAVFTNLGPEHLDRHRTMAAYGAAKRRLFVRGERAVPLAALNVDDPLGARLAAEIEERGGRALRYGRAVDADYRIVDCRWDLRGAELVLATPSGTVELSTRLPGRHNARNVAAALAVADALGLARGSTLAALATARPPVGRFAVIDADLPFDVIVDRGSTPASIAPSLDTIRAISAARGRRLVAVVGLVGNSAVKNGRESGALARERCDHLILSASSYRGEPRIAALAELAAGARSVDPAGVELIIDRREAIVRGIELARPGDVVAVIGRGDIVREATDLHGGFFVLDDIAVARDAVRAR